MSYYILWTFLSLGELQRSEISFSCFSFPQHWSDVVGGTEKLPFRNPRRLTFNKGSFPKSIFLCVDVVCQTAKNLTQRKWNLMHLFTNTFVASKHFFFPYNNKETSAKVVLCPLINTFKILFGTAKNSPHDPKRRCCL